MACWGSLRAPGMAGEPHEPTDVAKLWGPHPGELQRGAQVSRFSDDPEMIWAVATGKRGRQRSCSNAAIQTCLRMKMLAANGRVRRKPATPDRAGVDRARLQHAELPSKILAVNIPCRSSIGPLHPLIDSTGIKVEAEGKRNARGHGGPKRRTRHCPRANGGQRLSAQGAPRDRRANTGIRAGGSSTSRKPPSHAPCPKARTDPGAVRTRWRIRMIRAVKSANVSPRVSRLTASVAMSWSSSAMSRWPCKRSSAFQGVRKWRMNQNSAISLPAKARSGCRWTVRPARPHRKAAGRRNAAYRR